MTAGGKQISQIIRLTNGVSVLLLALLVRLVYCFQIAPRQLCGLNDHGNCELGSMVATAMQSRNLKYLALPTETPVFGTPPNLIDLLVRSGPVHPLYLGTIFHFSGLGGTLDAARVNCWPVVATNCLIDSLACVGIYYATRLIFNRRAAVLAALLSVFYPAAILNTMQSYPESLAYALVSIWICLAAKLMLRRGKSDFAWLSSYALGVISVLLALCLPSLMAMPIFAGGLMAAYKAKAKGIAATITSYMVPALALLLGCASALAPWFWLQQTAVATIRLYSVTVSESQLWAGNLLPCDGWTTTPPLDLYGDNFALTMRNFLKSLVIAPVQYFCLFCQKVPRLWAGSWNDYATPLFGLNAIGLNMWHGLLLLCAFLGASLSSLHHTRWRRSRTLPGAVGLVAIIVYHFAFALFSPLSRNAFTALPAVIILAAGGLEQLIRRNHFSQSSFLLLGSAILLFWRLASGSNTVPLVIGMTLSEQTAHVCDIALIVAAWIVLLLVALMAVRKTTTTQISSASDMLKAGCFFAIVGTIGCGYADQRWREWSAVLKSGNDAALETIKLPEMVNIPQLDTAGSAFVLLDASADEQPPPVVAAINQVSNGSEPIPWLMLKPFDSESFKTLALTANGMGRDWRSLRQWWAVPVPFSALKFGQSNQLSVMLQRSEEPLSCSIFGQYGLVIDHQNGTGTVSVLPSTNTLSWDKGFATYEAGDSRLLEQTIMQGKVVDSGLSNGSTVMKGDLSYERGLQGGHYRMRLAVPIKTGFTFGPANIQGEQTPPSQISIPFLKEDAITISGSEPDSQIVTGSGCILPTQTAAGSLMTFQCDLKGFTEQMTGAISIELTGTDELGQPLNWTSPRQPVCVTVSKEWKPFSVSEFIPESLAQSKDLRAMVKIVPYDQARLIAHRDAALKQQIGARQMKIELQSFLKLPREQNRDWVIF